MHHEMRAEIDSERKSIEEAGVRVLLTFQLLVRILVRLLQLDIFAVPLPTQRKIVITDHRRESRIGHEQFEHFPALRSFSDLVAYGNNTVVVLHFALLDQLHQLVVTTVNVSPYNRAARHS